MTSELQRAMAQYEEARIQYQRAVLASLNGTSNGGTIRQAIHKVQAASAWLKRYQGTSPTPPPAPQNEPSPSWGVLVKLLKAWPDRRLLQAQAKPPSDGPQVSRTA
jgi:hypothetical protein